MAYGSLFLSSFDYTAVEKNRIRSNSLLNPPYFNSVTITEPEKNKREDLSSELYNIYLSKYEGLSSIYKPITDQLENEFEKKNISQNVYKTSFDIINSLSESILFKLSLDNIYPSKYGTLILDWEDENSNDEFSLEIGNNCFGYFSELNGKDTFNIDEAEYNQENINLLQKRIQEFFNR